MQVKIDSASYETLIFTLPNETLTTIFEYLNIDALRNILQVCRRLHDISERLLYQNISICESVDLQSTSSVIPQKTILCCNTVLRRPYLASIITRLHIRWNRDHQFDCRLSIGAIQCINNMLRLCMKLDSLETHFAGLVWMMEDLMRGCTFRLRHFSFTGVVNVLSIQQFLQTQPSLLHLHIGDLHQPLVLERDALPKLEMFRGDPRTAASLVPTRPVYWLAFSGNDMSEESLEAFSNNPNSVRWLDLGNLSVTPNQLVLVSKHFSSIEWLRMKLALRHTLHFTFSGLMLLSPLTQVLCAFQNLTWLDLSSTSVDGVRGLQTESDECSLCATWGNVCPSLRRVKFPSGTDWTMSSEGIWMADSR